MGPWAEEKMGPRAEQSKTEFCPQPDKNKNDTYLPFLWYGGNKMTGEFVAVKRKKKKKVSLFLLSWEQRR